ncbi:membrane protein insertion efficiency factor YidD [Candidatus Peregrinibacteria bacterium]|nr:membrane protein insertion efficiency factor YidD [Candidatus Peregrinibacteria bacterium]
MRYLLRAFRAPFLWLIRLYQKTLSPDHGFLKALFPHGYCKYSPSCSEYTRLAIEKHGVFFGSTKGFWRILRCNPCSRGGTDNP